MGLGEGLGLGARRLGARGGVRGKGKGVDGGQRGAPGVGGEGRMRGWLSQLEGAYEAFHKYAKATLRLPTEAFETHHRPWPRT